ncbi:MAG: PPC domain-containing protein [Planctomycetota bacterium]|nr:PPC domain-containing protein [Planctomycetota bacterium]
MNLRHGRLTAVVVLAIAVAATAQQQGPPPQIGYVYPAGGQAGSELLVTVGGRNLAEASGARFWGEGLRAVVHEQIQLPNGKDVQTLRDELKELQARGGRPGRAGASKPATRPTLRRPLTPEDLKRLDEIRTLLMLVQKRRTNPALAESLVLRVTIDPIARPGRHEIRLETPGGLSNPLAFFVQALGEYRETESELITDRTESGVTLPVVINGQIMPGDVDRFQFAARKGQRLVLSAAARELVPYISDAVPGWFQAVIALYDSTGKELAYADHYGFRADPVLLCEIPADGQYVVESRDSLYRGREDFVYRLAVGELPFIPIHFPLGGQAGAKTPVALTGWNLPSASLAAEFLTPGVHPLSVGQGQGVSNAVPFAADALADGMEKEPNDTVATAQPITLPIIINGHIDRPGDVDVFRFEGRAGQAIIAEVTARRLDSPLDSVLRLTDSAGKQLAFNDDQPDPAAALQTHHADSLLTAALPADGTYYLHLGDAQHKGGGEYAYRLRVSGPRPDFALRVTPSSLIVRRGGSVPLTVNVLRHDGFAGEIALALKDPPAGFTLNGAKLPAGQDSVRVTLSGPPWPHDEPVPLHLEGRALIAGQPVVRPAVPADDLQQAFSYRHLVPAGELTASVVGRGRAWANVRLLSPMPVKLPLGGTAKVRAGIPLAIPQGTIHLELADPPEGISIASVSPAPNNTCEILFSADAKKVKPGLTGNLIVNILLERNAPASQSRPAAARRLPAGTLPAIPFKIIAAGIP